MKSAEEWRDWSREVHGLQDEVGFYRAIQRDALESAARICDKPGTGSITAAADIRALAPEPQEKP